MADDKPVSANVKGFPGGTQEPDEAQQKRLAARARNRTVMLTPEMTGQVRAILRDDRKEQPKADPLSEILPPIRWEKGESREIKEEQPELSGRDLSASGGAEEALTPGVRRPARPTEELNREAAAELLQRHSPPSRQRFMVNQNVAAQAASVVRDNRPADDDMGKTVEPQPVSVPEVAASRRKSKIVGFLVSFDNDPNGEVFEIHSGRWLLTSHQTAHGDYILINDESISPLHAIIRASSDGRVEVLDQLSEYGTAVLRKGAEEEEQISGVVITIEHGDVLRFGKRHFVVCVVP